MLFSEPKIPQFFLKRVYITIRFIFQCSSASRKFLNCWNIRTILNFIAKFQCSSASRKFLNSQLSYSIPNRVEISVLFSEPKIPQCSTIVRCSSASANFSALQRAENSSIHSTRVQFDGSDAFQCSSASRKFLNRAFLQLRQVMLEFQCSSASRKFLNQAAVGVVVRRAGGISVLFSEPKIPQ